MKRLFNLTAGVSLMLSVVAIGLWMRSRIRFDVFWFSLGNRLVVIHAQQHGLSCIVASGWQIPTAYQHESHTYGSPGSLLAVWPDFTNSGQLELSQLITPPGVGVLTGPAAVILRNGRSMGQARVAATRPAVNIVLFNINYAAGVLYPLILPAIWLYLAFRRWSIRNIRMRDGLSQVCGYDLCATPNRCPECGTEVRKPEGRDQTSEPPTGSGMG